MTLRCLLDALLCDAPGDTDVLLDFAGGPLKVSPAF